MFFTSIVIITSLLCCSEVIGFRQRPSSEPFISGDGFRAMSKFALDWENMNIDPRAVRAGDIIFLWNERVDYFFEKIHPLIQHPYVLITNNGDRNSPEGQLQLKMLDDEKLLAWFAVNVIAYHPKLHPIPIGIPNQYFHNGRIDAFTGMMKKKDSCKKKHLLYMNFDVQNSTERPLVHSLFVNEPYCYAAARTTIDNYLNDLAESYFVASPQGWGPDCCRTWEAMYMGAIPIVSSSSLDVLFEGLPVLIVKDWHEINEDFLRKKYEEMRSRKYDLKKLYFAYWKGKILAAAKQK